MERCPKALLWTRGCYMLVVWFCVLVVTLGFYIVEPLVFVLIGGKQVVLHRMFSAAYTKFDTAASSRSSSSSGVSA